ncbi:hypothetical protein SLEP1_g21891 [Rubroshorea leprosula]|uniref:Uncharacterized protein n=1 Tax=Rubroshorea leprosula TaxID=152421 RepID=A0AAV5JI94_9ROSI|nr:hypothetical protein SLEP1_g21891 [Rubroshorea leprosula]
MPQEQPLRRTLSRKRSMRLGDGRDDRGWTLLHIGARKGDLKEVCMLQALTLVHYQFSVYQHYCFFPPPFQF